MRVSSTTQAPPETGADTIAVGVFEGKAISHDVDGVLQGLVDAGEAKGGLRKLAVAHAGGKRYILVGLGKRDDFDAERARVAAAAAAAEAANAARDLQNAPGNEMTPSVLADRARALAGVQVDVWGREQIVAAGMGSMAAVAQGSEQEPQLI